MAKAPSATPEIPLLTGHKLEKSFASRLLFKDLSFGVPQKARIGLVGANGAGKSTLLKIIAGTVTADGGEVTAARGLRVALLEQDAAFPAGQTVREALHAALENAKIDPFDPQVLRRTEQTLSKLLLSALADESIESLSGGWKRRVQLAAAIVIEPDLLLMDEPTNHLDVESISWLEDFLTEGSIAYVLVSHDRLFLTRTVDSLYELDQRHPNGILVVEGNFATYLERKAEIMANLGEREKRLANRLRRETEWLRRGAQARQTKQRARIDSADTLAQEVSRLKSLNRKNRLEVSFADSSRAPEKLIEAKAISKTVNNGEDQILFDDLSMLITSRSRIGLLGKNGCGKTTLIRTLIGKEEPTTGKVVRADNLRVVHFEQGRDSIDSDLSVMRNLASEGDSVVYQGKAVNVKGYLSKFQFRPEQVDLPAGRLSGGERARLRIAQILLEPASLLILDEPTNDLDFDTLETLEEALDEYSGAVLIVSHDRTFLDNVTDEIWAFGTTAAPKLVRYASYLQWEQARTQELAQSALKTPTKQTTSNHGASGTAPSQSAEKPATKVSYKDKFEFEQMEKQIAQAEGLLAELETSASKVGSGPEQAELYSRIASQQNDIDRLYARWAELESKINAQ
ncbi:MAG: ABC-F family ATP-binding cassette domain-containing protein [Bdellovibrionales bacterium]|jgi:ATP-binding cassette subfamily F protein uup|nr:ABC-F family ATP-binding cassette domain-containing protein [Bdellovibrionales bacterium]